jgi:peptidoglycan/xylan/chitin deacetylase (PgdA/CDA1 family)
MDKRKLLTMMGGSKNINILYDRIIATQPDSLLLYYPMDETTGTTAVDNKNDYDGAITGTVTLNQTGIGDGKPSYLFSSDGKIDFMSAGFAAAFNAAEFTIGLWVKKTTWNYTGREDFVALFGNATNYIFIRKDNTANKIAGQYVAGGTGELTITDMTSTSWVTIFLTVSKAADSFHFIVNGIDTERNTLGTFSSAITSADIASHSNAYYFNGNMAHVAIWNKQLTVNECIGLSSVKPPFDKTAVVITLDDGLSGVMDVYNYDKTINTTVFANSDNVGTAGYLTLAQLQEMYASGWDIGNHTKTHAHLTALTEEQVKTEIQTCSQYLIDNSMPRAAYQFAYPYGEYNDDVIQWAQDVGILSARAIEYLLVDVDAKFVDRYEMSAYAVENTTTLETVKGYIDDCYDNAKYCILYMHNFVESEPTRYQWLISDYQALIDYIKLKGYKTKTISQLYADIMEAQV